MLEDIEFDQALRLTINNILLALYYQGITEVHLGGLMRIIGVHNENAVNYDNDLVVLDDNFIHYIETINEPRPADQPLH
jgi:hypothetical protein